MKSMRIKMKLCNNHKNRPGAAAVEFSIAISLLLMIMFASIEFARLNMLKHSIEHASYLAARRGIITGAKRSDVEDTAEFHLDILGVAGETITVSPNEIDDDTTLIDVTINVPMTGNTWISPAYFGGTMTARTRMLAERVAADMSGAAGIGGGDD
jgi:Flp pilus assembly protein TadG